MQTTTPTSHHSVFYRPGALPAAQPTESKHWRQKWNAKPLTIKCQKSFGDAVLLHPVHWVMPELFRKLWPFLHLWVRSQTLTVLSWLYTNGTSMRYSRKSVLIGSSRSISLYHWRAVDWRGNVVLKSTSRWETTVCLHVSHALFHFAIRSHRQLSVKYARLYCIFCIVLILCTCVMLLHFCF